MKHSDYITMQGDDAVITLAEPVNVAGAQVSELKMRSPTVGDMLVVEALDGNDAVREVTMIANLCMISTAELKAVRLKNYKRLQAALQLFLH